MFLKASLKIYSLSDCFSDYLISSKEICIWLASTFLTNFYSFFNPSARWEKNFIARKGPERSSL